MQGGPLLGNNRCAICGEQGAPVYSIPCGRIYYKEPAFAGFKNMKYSEAHTVHLQDVGYKEYTVCDKCAEEEYIRMLKLKPLKSAQDFYLSLYILLLAITPVWIASLFLKYSFITGVLITAAVFSLFQYLLFRSNRKKIEADSTTSDGKLAGVYSLISEKFMKETKEIIISRSEMAGASDSGTVTVERGEIDHHMIIFGRVLVLAAVLFAFVVIKALE